MKSAFKLVIAAGFCAAIGATGNSHADTGAEFYKGKQIRMVIGGGSGGIYDLYARALARYLNEYIPGRPTFVPQNMQGAGSVRATNYVYAVGPQDGTVIGAVQMSVPFLPLYGTTGIQYDPLKLQWIGSMNNEGNVCISWHDSPVKTIHDAFEKELILGTAGASSANSSQIIPAVLNNMLGTRFKIIAGYVGADISLAMERGEVHGRCGTWTSVKAATPQWIEQKKINVLVQLSPEPLQELKDVPMVMDLAKTQEQKDIFSLIFSPQVMGRPFVMGPGVPADRVQTIRKGFYEVSKDERLIKALAEQHLDVSLMTGERMEEIIGRVLKTPPEIVSKASDAMKFRN